MILACDSTYGNVSLLVSMTLIAVRTSAVTFLRVISILISTSYFIYLNVVSQQNMAYLLLKSLNEMLLLEASMDLCGMARISDSYACSALPVVELFSSLPISLP